MRDDSSRNESTTSIQVKNSLGKLHNAVSQALSHTNDKTIEQAENSLMHSERTVHQADPSLGHQGVELAEEILSEEKDRLKVASMNKKHKGPVL